MKIVLERTQRDVLTIKEGETFLWEGCLFMRLLGVVVESSIRAVDLETGEVCGFDAGDLVEPFPCKIVPDTEEG